MVRVALLNRQKHITFVVCLFKDLKNSAKAKRFNSSSVKFELSSSKVTTLFADLYGTPQMKIKELELKGLLRQFLAHLEFFWIGLLSYYLAYFRNLFYWIVTQVSCSPGAPLD